MDRFRRSIVVRLEFEATHRWENCDIPEVSFLKYPHRHIFHIQCVKLVTHNDRDIEIIRFKRSILSYLEERFPSHDLGNMSCEMLATELLKEFKLYSCWVFEDNENGAIIETEKDFIFSN